MSLGPLAWCKLRGPTKRGQRMRSVKDVEAYLGRLNRSYRPVDGEAGTFLIETSSSYPPIALRVDPPLVVVRVHIGDVPGSAPGGKVPASDNTELFRKLLQFN